MKAGGNVSGENNSRARECTRLDTLETFGTVGALVENINGDKTLNISATLGGVWDALERTEYGGFYKGKVWVCFTEERKAADFSTQTDEGRKRRDEIACLIQSGIRNTEIREIIGASEKLVRSVRRELKVSRCSF